MRAPRPPFAALLAVVLVAGDPAAAPPRLPPRDSPPAETGSWEALWAAERDGVLEGIALRRTGGSSVSCVPLEVPSPPERLLAGPLAERIHRALAAVAADPSAPDLPRHAARRALDLLERSGRLDDERHPSVADALAVVLLPAPLRGVRGGSADSAGADLATEARRAAARPEALLALLADPPPPVEDAPARRARGRAALALGTAASAAGDDAARAATARLRALLADPSPFTRRGALLGLGRIAASGTPAPAVAAVGAIGDHLRGGGADRGERLVALRALLPAARREARREPSPARSLLAWAVAESEPTRGAAALAWALAGPRGRWERVPPGLPEVAPGAAHPGDAGGLLLAGALGAVAEDPPRGRAGPGDVVPLLAWLDDGRLDPVVRGAAATSLGILGRPDFAAGLRSRLRDPRHRAIAPRIAEALGLLADRESAPLLADRLLDTGATMDERVAAARALGWMAASAPADRLLGVLRDPAKRWDPGTRALAAAALGRMAAAPHAGELRSLFGDLPAELLEPELAAAADLL